MATTTNYGWTTPDDTALVKDGASAIRTLGTSVDTTTKNLNPETTLGDIAYRSSTANVKTRLGIGTTGQLLSVVGGVPAWTTLSSGGMTLINSGGTAMTGTTVSFTSIPTTYKMLQLHIINVGSSGNINTIMRFNGDTGSNYSFNSQQNSGTANQAAFSNGTVTSIQSLGFTNTANNKNSYFIQLPEYTLTSGEQPVYARSNSTDTSFVTSGSYTKSAAITQIDIISDGNSWDNGTAYLYGVS